MQHYAESGLTVYATKNFRMVFCHVYFGYFLADLGEMWEKLPIGRTVICQLKLNQTEHHPEMLVCCLANKGLRTVTAHKLWS